MVLSGQLFSFIDDPEVTPEQLDEWFRLKPLVRRLEESADEDGVTILKDGQKLLARLCSYQREVSSTTDVKRDGKILIVLGHLQPKEADNPSSLSGYFGSFLSACRASAESEPISEPNSEPSSEPINTTETPRLSSVVALCTALASASLAPQSELLRNTGGIPVTIFSRLLHPPAAWNRVLNELCLRLKSAYTEAVKSATFPAIQTILPLEALLLSAISPDTLNATPPAALSRTEAVLLGLFDPRLPGHSEIAAAASSVLFRIHSCANGNQQDSLCREAETYVDNLLSVQENSLSALQFAVRIMEAVYSAFGAAAARKLFTEHLASLGLFIQKPKPVSSSVPNSDKDPDGSVAPEQYVDLVAGLPVPFLLAVLSFFCLAANDEETRPLLDAVYFNMLLATLSVYSEKAESRSSPGSSVSPEVVGFHLVRVRAAAVITKLLATDRHNKPQRAQKPKVAESESTADADADSPAVELDELFFVCLDALQIITASEAPLDGDLALATLECLTFLSLNEDLRQLMRTNERLNGVLLGSEAVRLIDCATETPETSEPTVASLLASADRARRGVALYGLLALFANLTMRPALESAENASLSELKRYAAADPSAGQKPRKPATKVNAEIDAFCAVVVSRNSRAGVLSAIFSRFPRMSAGHRRSVVQLLRSLAGVPALRGRLVALGAVPVALAACHGLAAEAAKNKYLQPLLVAARSALAALFISVNPTAVAPSVPLVDVVACLAPQVDISGATSGSAAPLLDTFEALLALTNLATVSEAVCNRIIAEIWSTVDGELLFCENSMVKRAVLELLCNLCSVPRGAEKFLDTSQPSCMQRLRVFALLSELEDYKSRLAVLGGLAVLCDYGELSVAAVLACRFNGKAVVLESVARVLRQPDLDEALVARVVAILQSLVAHSSSEQKAALSKCCEESELKAAAAVAVQAVQRGNVAQESFAELVAAVAGICR